MLHCDNITALSLLIFREFSNRLFDLNQPSPIPVLLRWAAILNRGYQYDCFLVDDLGFVANHRIIGHWRDFHGQGR
jgi:hypothetical protein